MLQWLGSASLPLPFTAAACGGHGKNRAGVFAGARAGARGTVIHKELFSQLHKPFIATRFSTTIPRMPARRQLSLAACMIVGVFAPPWAAQQTPPAPPSPTAARILLLPRRIVSGERATLAVLDVNGRLTPGVTVNFSNGDRLTTDATGRALFVAPLNPGVIFASIAGRMGRVATAILSPSAAASASIEVSSVPRGAALLYRF